MTPTPFAQNIIDAIKTQVPASEELIAYKFEQQPVRLFQDDSAVTLGHSTVFTLTFEIGYLPDGLKGQMAAT